jgi:membrane-associated phospholipid phosphatase
MTSAVSDYTAAQTRALANANASRAQASNAQRLAAPGAGDALAAARRSNSALSLATDNGFSPRGDGAASANADVRGPTFAANGAPLLLSDLGPAATQPAPALARTGGVPDGYWRQDIWHQMGRESLDLGTRDLWLGFKHAFWNVPNMLVLTATFGASLSIQGTGVDAAVRRRTVGQHELGDADEPLQLLGYPGTHFAAAGLLWLGSGLAQDFKTHEFSRALAQALCVNGITVMALKVSANTRTPDNEHMGWPSGHTSSAFTVAAVVNEYYGPLAGVPAFALAGLVGYQRLDSRVHDFSDVVFGAVMGYVIGSSIARENKMTYPEIFGMKVVPYIDPETGTSGIALMKTQ